MINSREKLRFATDDHQPRRFILSLPQREVRSSLTSDSARVQEIIKVYGEASPGHFNLYLDPAIVEAILSLKQDNYTLTLPAQIILQLVYRGYLQEGWRSGVTFCGYARVKGDQGDLSRDFQLFTRTFVSVDGDVINQIQRDFSHHPHCLQILRAYYWLCQQILLQIQRLLDIVAGNVTGVIATSLLAFRVGNSFLPPSVSFFLRAVWFCLSGVTVFWFWWWSQQARSRLAQFLNNHLPPLRFPAFLDTPPWRIIADISSVGLLVLTTQEQGGIVASVLLFPFLYHILRTQILPKLSRWFLSGLFSSPWFERLVGKFL